MLKPGNRKKLEAMARLRPLAILDASVRGEKFQPGDSDLEKLATQLSKGKSWREVFPGAASIEFTTDDSGIGLNLRITKKEGLAFHLVAEGTPGASVIAVKRVGDLDYYNLDYSTLAKHSKLSTYELNSIIWHLRLKESDEFCRQITLGQKTLIYRYSQKALTSINACLKKEKISEIRKKYQARDKN